MKKGTKIIVIILSIFALLLITIAVPIVINELYKVEGGYLTKWGADDVLSYYGNVLSFIGTILLGAITVYLSIQANNMNKRLLNIEESRFVPCLSIDKENSSVQEFEEHCIDISLGLKNDTDNVINILKISNISCESIFSKVIPDIPYCNTWTKHYTVLPKETRFFNFFIENHLDEPILAEIPTATKSTHNMIFIGPCKLNVELKFSNSEDIYFQEYEFDMIVLKSNIDKSQKIIINNTESSVFKEDTQNANT